MDGREIRARFLRYFAGHGHTVVPSSPLVPADDPTLLFTNAGMVQFKDVFTGAERRPYVRAASSQKCVRAGGKHNDLENVGRTARHHTFFEMLGNFSFGDYFKREAITFAWELFTTPRDRGGYGLPKERLWATVYQDDDEAFELWRELSGLPPERVVRFGEKDNFWAMGETGPCGPCSELHIDRGPAYAGAPHECAGIACECDRFIELWNLVFMQFERSAGGKTAPLPRPSIDTGAGLERLTSILEEVPTNYDNSLLRPLVAAGERLAGRRYLADDETDVSLRVLADHARATAFLIADGVFPDRTGREYVLRRIMRRAIRHGVKLGIDRPFLHELTREVVGLMGEDYPELRDKEKVIVELTRAEEERFRETLDRGLKLIAEWRGRGAATMPGEVVFKLYDTYGFPTDLVEVIGREQGFAVDLAGFETAMAAQRERGEFKGSGDKARARISAEVAPEACRFVGYHRLAEEARVLWSAGEGDGFEFVADVTPFYAESGGQVADTGTAEGDGFAADVVDVQKSAEGLTVHRARLRAGERPRPGDRVVLRVDAGRRMATVRHHSATHLLHWALRRHLGDHVMQKGSLVEPARLRFDFAHFAPVPDERARAIEESVAELVLADAESVVEELSFDEARRRGAIAFFGDKYGDRVRVVRIGRESLELCGGTHVGRSGEIGMVKLVSEGGVAQGVRRVEAVAGPAVLEWARRLEDELRRASETLRSAPYEVAARVEKLQRELRDRDKELEALRRKLAGGGRDLLSEAREIAGVQVLAARLEVADPRALRETGDQLRDRLGSGLVVLFGVTDGQVALLAMVTRDLAGRFHAGKIVGELAGVLGGRGGGRPDMAQAGGGDPARVDEAIERAYQIAARSPA